MPHSFMNEPAPWWVLLLAVLVTIAIGCFVLWLAFESRRQRTFLYVYLEMRVWEMEHRGMDVFAHPAGRRLITQLIKATKSLRGLDQDRDTYLLFLEQGLKNHCRP